MWLLLIWSFLATHTGPVSRLVRPLVPRYGFKNPVAKKERSPRKLVPGRPCSWRWFSHLYHHCTRIFAPFWRRTKWDIRWRRTPSRSRSLSVWKTVQSSEKQVTRGHNIVTNGWAGAANPHPNLMPHLTPFPTQTHKKTITLVLSLFNLCGRTDEPMDGQSLL